MKLLIVDDSELIRTRLIGLFDGIPGIEAIHTAVTLAQTLESVRRVLPTLVILDLHFPDGNAIPIINTIKVLAPGVQIAMLSNDASEFNRRKCLVIGADWFFDKSTEFESLLEAVREQAGRN
ncbi:MAG: response regulator [Burkholderiaceae bacterium]|nr:response regulator [Burkholderiaceae bacterium]